MHIQNASMADFDAAFSYIVMLWDYNTYDREETRRVYAQVLEDPNSFAFFLADEQGGFHGFCHGTWFPTFWLSGPTCYVSSLITNPEDRGRGYGTRLLDHARALAKERGCRAMVLDSGLPRTRAHGFYEHYGFEKSCYGFDYDLTRE